MSFARNLMVGLSVGTLSQLLSALVAILVIRKLGPHDRGVYAMVVALNTSLTCLLDMGISAANETFLGKGEHPAGSINCNSVVCSLVLGALGVALGLTFRKTLMTRILPGVDISYSLLGLLLLPLTLYCLYAESILVGIGKIVLLNKISLLQSLMLAVGSTLFVLVFHGGVGGLLMVWAASYIVTALGTFAVLQREDGVWFDRSLLWQSLSFGARASIARAFRLGSFRLDSFFVNAVLGTTAAGYYSVATALTDKVGPAMRALFNAANRKITEAERESSFQLTARIARTLIPVLVVGGILVMSMGEFIIRVLFGRAFLPAVAPLRILCLGVILFSLASTFVLFFQNQMRRPGFVSAVIGVMVVGSVPLYRAAVPLWGLTGAAWVTCSTYAGLLFLFLVAFSKVSGLKFRDVLLIRSYDIQNLMAMSNLPALMGNLPGGLRRWFAR
jgi:O-antigen/teichoic acid export membrane protein